MIISIIVNGAICLFLGYLLGRFTGRPADTPQVDPIGDVPQVQFKALAEYDRPPPKMGGGAFRTVYGSKKPEERSELH